jgi:hypothetical protein
MLKPGNLISFQPSHPPSEGLNVISFGTEYAKVKWLLKNTIGLFVKISPDDRNRAICLFDDQLFIVPITAIEPIGDCNV